MSESGDEFEVDLGYLARLGVSGLRDVQHQVIGKMLSSGADMISVMPTGSGKTLCFQYYSLAVKNLVIIVYPLISLINDQKKRFDRANIPCAILKGGQTKAQRAEELKKLFSRNANVIITNPETLTQKTIFNRLSGFKNITLVCDECHTLIEWGKTFRSKMLELSAVDARLKFSRILLFTATLSPEVEQGIRELFPSHNFEKLYYSANRENIEYRHIVTTSRNYMLYKILEQAPRPAIIFANNRVLCQELSGTMGHNFPLLDIRYYHAGLSKQERKEIEDWFYKSADGVLIATCAFGMGVDKSNVRSVIHYMLPQNVSAFLQESGRAGRDGEHSVSYSIITNAEIKKEKSPSRIQLLNCFLQKTCTRTLLLKAMGESSVLPSNCLSCSTCNSHKTRDNIYILVTQIIKEYSTMYSARELALLLKGVQIFNIPFCRKLAFYGLLKNLKLAHIFEYIEQELYTQKNEKLKSNKFVFV